MKPLALIFILVGLAAGAWSRATFRLGRAGRQRSFILAGAAAASLLTGAGLYLSASLPLSQATGSPGVARLCLTDPDIDLSGDDKIELPATTVLDDAGVLQGDQHDPASWNSTPGVEGAAIVTQAAVALTRRVKCTDVSVKMLIAPFAKRTNYRAGENHVFVISDVLDYPIPARKPAVEIGRLVDDIGVKAVLLSDVTAAVAVSVALSDEQSRADACLKVAQGLAADLGMGIARQSEQAVFLRGPGAPETSLTCPPGSKTSPDLFVSWDGQLRPPSSTLTFLAKAGADLTGAAPAEVQGETEACIEQSQQPDADEGASRQFRGVKLDCQASLRNGGGGSVTVGRRFGVAPDRPAMTAQAREAMDRLSKVARGADEGKAADALAFAKWYQDPAIPQAVKAFAMIAARKIALAERCPSWHFDRNVLSADAREAGVEPADLQPGGKYAGAFDTLLQSMRAGTANESVASACTAAQRYR